MRFELATKRLLLRPLSLVDVDLAMAVFTDPAVVKHVGKLMTPEEISESMATWTKRGGNGCIGIWCVTEKDTGAKIGTGALLPMPIEEEDTNWGMVIEGEMPEGDVEVGYILKQSAWGEGYATEICQRLLQFVFEETSLKETVATFDDGHLKSRHVLEKCGFVDKGRRFCYGEDSVDFRITRDQWITHSHSGRTNLTNNSL